MATKNEGKLGQVVQLDAVTVFGDSVQLPMFDRTEPDAWFILAEANFNLRGVTDSRTKYWYVLSKFDASTLKKLSTFLQLLRGDDPYRELREMLCETYEPPMEQKLDAFLGLTEIGDERPSVFGLEIQQLTAKSSMDHLRKRVFLSCLPGPIVTAIAGSLQGSFNTVVKAADRAWTAASTASGALQAAATLAAVANTSQVPFSQGGKRKAPQRGARPTGQMTSLHIVQLPQKVRRFGKEVCSGLFAFGRAQTTWESFGSGIPGGRDPRRWEWDDQNGLRKRVGRSLSAAGPMKPTKPSRPAQLGLIMDQRSRQRCLIDTGSQVSLLPPSPATPTVQQSRVRLMAANGTPIKAFGHLNREIKIGGKSYSFIFLRLTLF